MINAALSGALDGVTYRDRPGLQRRRARRVPRRAGLRAAAAQHVGDAADYDAQAKKLAKMFVDNFKTYEDVGVAGGPGGRPEA